MRGHPALALCVVLGRLSHAAFTVSMPPDVLSGGDTTVFDTSRNAFSLRARNLREEPHAAFFVGNPFQYINNIAFGYKLLFMALAGVNVFVFYATGLFRTLVSLGPGDDAPVLAKVIAAMSLFLWIAVMYMGRMLPYIGNSF